MSTEVKCPKCDSNQITSHKKGYSVGKAAAGVVLTGGIGLVAGAIGSGTVKITCLSCGYQYKAGDYASEKRKFDDRKRALKNAQDNPNPQGVIIALFIFGALLGFVSYQLYGSDWNFFGTIFAIGAFLLIIFGLIGIYAEKSK